MWSFLIWVKHLIISAVLAWVGVNMAPPEQLEWTTIREQVEPGARACHSQRTIVLRTRGETRVIRTNASACAAPEGESSAHSSN